MPMPSDDIQVGRCYLFSAFEIRKVLKIVGASIETRPYGPGGWGDPVRTPLSDFAENAQYEVECPVGI